MSFLLVEEQQLHSNINHHPKEAHPGYCIRQFFSFSHNPCHQVGAMGIFDKRNAIFCSKGLPLALKHQLELQVHMIWFQAIPSISIPVFSILTVKCMLPRLLSWFLPLCPTMEQRPLVLLTMKAQQYCVPWLTNG